MTLKVKHGKFKIGLWAPLRPVTAVILKKAAKHGYEIKDLKILRKEIYAAIKEYKRANGSFELFRIDSNDGTKVVVKL